MVKDFTFLLQGFDKLVSELRDKMKHQTEHVTSKMRSIMNGRDNDINKRKVIIHKRLAKYVNKECNNRRIRLKMATATRRQEFAIEEKCVTALSDLTGSLRRTMDDMWVKEHLRERRIFEASLGRMRRLEKSALIIWNKHSHLAIDQDEDYIYWIESYRKDRSLINDERVYELYKQWKIFHGSFTKQGKSFVRGLKRTLRDLFSQGCDYNIQNSVEKNNQDFVSCWRSTVSIINGENIRLKDSLRDYMDKEMQNSESNHAKMRRNLVTEWHENMFRMNTAINRRIGSLKDMESDLEETIRLTIAQHEVESTVFEQTSCTRYEEFWIDWRQKFVQLSRTIQDDYSDYLQSKSSSKSKGKKSKSDRALDEVLALPNIDQLDSKVTSYSCSILCLQN